jgi:hypothetical protein
MKEKIMKYRTLAGITIAIGMLGANILHATPYTQGNVFLGVTGVGVEEFTPTGTYVQTINGGALSQYVTGMAFQNNGNLLVTDFSGNKVAQYNNSGALLNGSWASGIGSPESIAIDAAGHVYVSSVGATGITEYASGGGSAIGTTLAGTRTDWIDLGSDQHTMLYTNESGTIFSVNVATNTANPTFSTLGGDYALRIIPSGTYAGDVLAANSSNALLLSTDGSSILKTYTWAANAGSDFALNIDPNGTSFWTADTSGNVASFDISTGTLLDSWSFGTGSVFGLAVYGQQTASGGGGGGGTTTVSEPSGLAFFGFGLGLLGLVAGRRQRRLG